jgi:hypothetical protein
MGCKNGQIHLLLETELLNRLKREAQQYSITLSELCRRKLLGEAISEEIILIRKVMEVLKNEKK